MYLKVRNSKEGGKTRGRKEADSLSSVPVASSWFPTPPETTVTFPAKLFPSALTSKVAESMVLEKGK